MNLEEGDDELKDEVPPEGLRKKWEAEDFKGEIVGRQDKQCGECGKWVDEKALTCMYCDATVFHQSGLLGKILYGVRSQKWVFVVVVVSLIATFIAGMIL